MTTEPPIHLLPKDGSNGHWFLYIVKIPIQGLCSYHYVGTSKTEREREKYLFKTFKYWNSAEITHRGETWRVGDGMERAKGNFFTADKTSISSTPKSPKQVFVLPQMQAEWSLQTVSQTSRQEFSVFHPHMTTKLFHVRVTWTLVGSCLENCVCVCVCREQGRK